MANIKLLLATVGVVVPAAIEWIVLCLSALFLAISTAENIAGIAAKGVRRLKNGMQS